MPQTETDNLLDNDIPEKFKDPESGEINIAAMTQSYRELEKRLSQNPAAPKTPEDYCIDCAHGLFQPDPDINRRLHEKGFSHEQAQEVYDLAAERMVPMIRDMSEEFDADREIEKLVSHYGGPDKWKEISRQLLAFGQKNLPADVLDNLASSFEGVLALERMMKSEEPSLKKAGEAPAAPDEKDLNAMMRDPRYWRERDPAFVAKVTDGFRQMYGVS